jgi:hypothetical protein
LNLNPNNKATERNKRDANRKERSQKLSLFVNNIILYSKAPKDASRRVSDLINTFSKVAGYKINIQKSNVFLNTNKDHAEKEVKETIPFTIASKKKKKKIQE